MTTHASGNPTRGGGASPASKTSLSARARLPATAVVLFAVWIAVAFGAVYYAVHSQRAFRASLVRVFDEQQEFTAALIRQLLENHVRESVQDLSHLAHMYQGSSQQPPDYTGPAARILRDHEDTFQAIAVVGPRNILLHHTGGPGAPNPLDSAVFDKVDAASATTPFISERVVGLEGQPATHLFVPFHLPAPGGPRHLIVGELNLKRFMATDLGGLVGRNVGVVLADYFGDIYFISNREHDGMADMERGRIFPPGPECVRCHREEGFDDIRKTAETGEVGHRSYRSPQGKLIDRTSLAVPILNDTWIVSISTPYERVQGQISDNARRHTLSTLVLLALLGAGAMFTHRYQGRKALQRQYYSIIDTVRVGMCRLSPDGTVLGANPAFAELFEMPQKDLSGRAFADLAVDPAAARAFLGVIREQGVAMDCELELVRHGGGSFVGALSGVGIRESKGARLHVDVAVQDVTARKRAEAELRTTKNLLERQNEDLVKLDRMKDALLRDVAHELKTPVAKHAMQLEILRPMLQARTIQERELRAFQVMEESVRRQRGVISNLLNLARLEAGGHQYRKESLRLDDLLARVKADYQYAIDTYGIRFDLDVPQIAIRSDEEMLWHVFSNLVSNAIKFRRPGVQASIAVRAVVTETHVIVRVEDNGLGVPPEDRERVFTRFYQATASSEGSGVGLSICRNIVNDLGGRIGLASPDSELGTAVEVELPRG